MNLYLKKLQNSLPQGADAAIIESSVNRRYYTQMPSSAGTLFVTRDYAALIIDFRYIEKAREQAKDCEVILQQKLFEQVKQLSAVHNVKSIAIEGGRMTVSRLKEWQKALSETRFITEGLDPIINSHRRIKTAGELDFIRAAQAVTDKTFTELLNFIKAGITERQLKCELERLLSFYGGDGIAFDTIAVSGKNSSLPHGVPTDKVIEPGDFVTMDFGAQKFGYCSDMTRTVAVSYVSDEQRRVYDTVLQAQQKALEVIKAGVCCHDIDAAARNYIEQEKGYKDCFGHGLGHSLGLEIHEMPSFSPSCDVITEKGMVMSVEPGIYLEGKFGVRIEDIIAVGENGFENLTHSPKELIIL